MTGERTKHTKYINFHRKTENRLSLVKVCFTLALMLFATSCNPPIWSRMKKRVEAERMLKALKSDQNMFLSDDFKNVYGNWVPEAEGNYSLHYLEKDSCLDIKTDKGLTLWNKTPFEGDLRIKYEICAVDQGESIDRVSDLDCYWMASDPAYPDSIFTRMNFRKGASSRYYSLQLYCMNVGENSNTVTRFRRYDGNYDDFRNEMKRPGALFQYKDELHLIHPNHWYSIEIKVQQGRVLYIQDGEVLVDYLDPSPLIKGSFGIRTSENHIRVRNFRVYKL